MTSLTHQTQWCQLDHHYISRRVLHVSRLIIQSCPIAQNSRLWRPIILTSRPVATGFMLPASYKASGATVTCGIGVWTRTVLFYCAGTPQGESIRPFDGLSPAFQITDKNKAELSSWGPKVKSRSSEGEPLSGGKFCNNGQFHIF